MIKPTVGRVLWYWPNSSAEAPLSAQVARVFNDRCVTLGVLDKHGNSFNAISVQLLQDDDERPDSTPFCEWMPYQKEQAEKVEADTIVSDIHGSVSIDTSEIDVLEDEKVNMTE